MGKDEHPPISQPDGNCRDTRIHLEVSSGVGRILNARRHVPMLDQASPDHPPDVCNHADAPDAGSALEVGDGEVGAGGVGTDEDVLDLDGAGA